MAQRSQNPLAKSKAQPLTPAQLMSQKIAIERSQQDQKFWMPIQNYFAERVNREAPGLKEQARGTAAATAREQAQGMTEKQLSADTNAGAAPGSGRYLMDVGKGTDLGSTSSSVEMTKAAAMSDRSYANSLGRIVSNAQKEQKIAEGGLNTAAQEQAQEAGIITQANTAQQQAGASAIGTIASIAAMA